MAFDCPHCGHRSNELQQANAIAIGGAIYKCHVTTKADLNRQLVKTNTAVVKIPEIDFEIPAQRGHLTTIEGLLLTVISDLEADQPLRKVRIQWRRRITQESSQNQMPQSDATHVEDKYFLHRDDSFQHH